MNYSEMRAKGMQLMEENYSKFLFVAVMTVLVYGLSSILSTLGIQIFAISGIMFFVALFVGPAITVGGLRMMINAKRGKAQFSDILYVFKSGNYWNVFVTMLLMEIKIILWTLLFIVPGIIKSLEYSMVPYLLAEDAGMDGKLAFDTSREMTDGKKGNMFILALTFIGWILLIFLATFVITLVTLLACRDQNTGKLIGTILGDCLVYAFFVPYVNATFVVVYEFLAEMHAGKTNSLQNHID